MTHETPKKIRLLLADDHPIVRQGLRLLLEADKQLTVIGEASDGRQALEQLKQLQPDVAILDIDMPQLDGFAVVRALQSLHLPVAVIFLTMHSEQELFEAALDLGVKGYVLKESATTDIVHGVKLVAEGKSYLSPALSDLLLKRRSRQNKLEDEQPGLSGLSPTERRVLKLIAEDRTTKEIAAELFISYRTVETHRANICKKLGLHGSMSLLKFAVAHKSEL